MNDIRPREVLRAVLLQVLSQHQGGLPIHAVYDVIHQTHTFPEEWYREIPLANAYDTLKQLGHLDWRKLPQSRLVELVATEPQWQNELRWTRNELREAGRIDATAPRGVWRLTTASLETAKYPQLDNLTLNERRIVTTTRNAPPRAVNALSKNDAASGLRDALLQKLKTLTQSMPLEDLDLLVDIARSVRARSLNVEA